MPPSSSSLDIVFIGLAITSSWGNGHATTYRSLVKGLGQRGHRTTFLEQDQPWYAAHRDQPVSPFCTTELYRDLPDLQRRFGERIRKADAVIVGSYVDRGIEVCEWVLAEARGVRGFYDIDTPVTLRTLEADRCQYLSAAHIPEFDVMLSFTGGPTLEALEGRYRAQRARALYCSVDTDQYRPQGVTPEFALAYMGTYSDDRQPGVERFLNQPARALPDQQFMVVGAQFPQHIEWPANVQHREHLPPHLHAAFYGSQRFTLNVTRADMRAAGWSPSVRLFEAAACGTPIISDDWPGLTEVFSPNDEILIVHTSAEVVRHLASIGEPERLRIAAKARERAVAEHSSERRAAQLEQYIGEVVQRSATRRTRAVG